MRTRVAISCGASVGGLTAHGSYPVPKLMEKEQTCGKVTYTDDEPLLPGTLFAAPVYSDTGNAWPACVLE